MKSIWYAFVRVWRQRAWRRSVARPRYRSVFPSQTEELGSRILPAVFTITPTADGVISDDDGDGDFDSLDEFSPKITSHFSLGPVERADRGVYEFDLTSLPNDAVISSVVLRLNFTDVVVPPALDYWVLRILGADGDGTIGFDDLANATNNLRDFSLSATFPDPAGLGTQYDIALSPLYFQSRLQNTQFISLVTQMLSVDGTLTVDSQNNQAVPANRRPQLIVTTGVSGPDAETELTLIRSTASISESAGANAASLLVSRNSANISEPLDVFLLSSNPSAATVPAHVIIPANMASIQVPITAVDDSLLDGTQLVRFSANANMGPATGLSLSTDPTFGGDNGVMVPGVQRIDRPIKGDFTNVPFHKILVQPDGKILTLVSRSGDSGMQGGPGSTLSRLNPDGTLDTTFGIKGVVDTAIPNAYFNVTTGMTIQSDGKIVVVGNTGGSDWTLVRYNTDGSIDKPFGTFGVVHDQEPFPFGYLQGSARDVVQLQDGSLLVAGTWAGVKDDTLYVTKRYLADGTPVAGSQRVNNATGPSGMDSNKFDLVNGMTLQPDGKAIVFGGLGTVTSAAIVRRDAQGDVDLGFALFTIPGGRVAAEAVAVQPDGKIVIVARVTDLRGGPGTPAVSTGDLVIFRCTSQGQLDGSFGTGGFNSINLNAQSPDLQKFSVVVQPDNGRIIVGMSADVDGKQLPAFVAFTSSGVLDTSAGANGVFKLSAPNGYSTLHGAALQSMAIQPDGRVVALVVGYDGAAVVRIVSGAAQANSETMAVVDHETLTVTLSRDTFSEGAGQFAAFGTVTRSNTDIDLPLTVVLSSGDTSELTVPATITIPAHSQFKSFIITAVDDALFDGNQTVTLTVSAPGYVPAINNITVTDNEVPGALTPGDILVTRPGFAPGTYDIAEYTAAGTFVQVITIPWGGGGPRPVSEIARDLIQDQFGRLYLFNGTITPFLTSVTPPSVVFNHQNFAGWSSSTASGAGGIATFHQFIFASDSNTSPGAAAGIVRFDRTDNSILRVSNGLGYQDLTVGLNGLLYALNQNRHIDVYDPVTLGPLGAVDLPVGDYRGIAVRADGKILAAGADGKIYLFDAAGVQLASVNSGAASLTDIDIDPTGRVIAGSLAGEVIVTDQNLAAPTKFTVSSSEAFVAFALDAAFPNPTVHVNQQALTVLENGPPTNIDAALVLTDDGATLIGATVTFSTGYVVGGDRLAFTDQNGITGVFDAETGILKLDGAASVATYQAALRSVKYFTASNTPAASRTVTITVTDGAFSGSADRTILVTPENDAPRVTANQFLFVTENSPNGTVVGTVTAFDDDSPVWSGYTIVSGNAAGIFAINPATGVITVADGTHLDFEVAQSYSLGITVTDGSLVSPVQPVTILLTDLNDTTPVIPSGQVFFVTENSPNNVSLGTVAALDADSVGDLQNFTIVSGNSLGIWGLDANTGNLFVVNGAALDYEGQRTYTLGIRVSDGVHQSAVQTIQIQLNDQNDVAPVVTAGLSFSIPEGSTNGTAVGTVTATDVDTIGTLQNFAIVSGNGSGAFQIDSITGLITVKNSTPLNFEVTPVFALGVVVSDGVRNSAVQTVNIQLTDVNESPSLTNQTFSVAELSAAGVVVGTIHGTDPDAGQSLSYTITSGNGGSVFTLNPSTGVLTVSNGAVLDFETTPVYTFTVTATDNGSPALFGSALITVNLTNVNDVPTITAGQSFTIAENNTNGANVGTVQARDADAGQELTYSITNGNASGAFAINPTTGVISVADATKLDFETVPTFTLTVKVVDNGAPALSASATVVVQVGNVNEAPTISPATFSLPENSPKPTFVGTVIAQDPDAGQTKQFSIIGGNTDNAFSIHFSLGTISVNNPAALDFETSPTFLLTVRVQDNGVPSLFSTATITINLTDGDDPPSINNQSFSVSEAASAGTNVGTVVATNPNPQLPLTYEILSGNSAGIFSLNAQTGALSIADPTTLDFESQPSIALQVRVTSGGAQPLASTATITVNLIDANESPSLGNATFNVAENSIGGTVVGTLTATDPDAGQSLTYAITGGNTNGVFEINPTSGAIRVANGGVVDFETTANYALTVSVTDSGTPQLAKSAQVTIHVNDVNEPPVLPDQSVNVAENSPAGTVVATLVAANPESAQQLTYSILLGNANNSFSIDPATGQISVLNNAILNFENQTQLVLTVQVADNGQPSLSDTATLTIHLTDVNEPPHLTPATFTLAENSPTGTVVGTIQAGDQDAGQQTTYTITGSDLDGLFAISPNGVLSIANPALLDFETHPVIHLTVTATDNGTPTAADSQQFTVNLTNVDEPLEIVLTPGVRVLPTPVKPQALDPQAQVRDVDTPGVNVANTTLTVRVTENASSTDKVRLLKSKSGDVVFKATSILFQGTVIGERIYGKKGGIPLTVRFNSSATQAGVEGVLRKIYYQTKGTAGSQRTLEFNLTGLPGGKSSKATKVVQLG